MIKIILDNVEKEITEEDLKKFTESSEYVVKKISENTYKILRRLYG